MTTVQSKGEQPISFAYCAGFALFLLAGCVAHSTKTQPAIEESPPFAATGEAALEAEWWTAFGDAKLNRMMNRALRGNFTLASAWERLRAAQALAEREASGLYPALDGVAGGGAANGIDAMGDEQLELGLEASYEADLWGRIQSIAEAERYRAQAALADYRTAALSLSFEVARAWYQLIEARNQLDILNDQIETNTHVLNLLKARFGAGQVRGADILRQRQLTEATREQAVSARLRIELLEHQLAVLQGIPPQTPFEAGARELPALPPMPSVGPPGELAGRRPDVQGAFLRLRAADEDLAAAISNQYPRVTLGASVLTSENGASQLFSNWLVSIAGNLAAPIYGAREREAEARRAGAARQEQVYNYAQTVLNAFQEVEDAIERELKQEERIRSLEIQYDLARQTYRRLRFEYFNGAEDYIGVLTSLADEQQLRRDLLLARRNRIEFRIALHRALAGGFETPRERSGSAVARRENDGAGND